MKIKRAKLSTKTFDDLINIIDIIKNDTSALFANMRTMNPLAEAMRNKFIAESIALNKALSIKQRKICEDQTKTL